MCACSLQHPIRSFADLCNGSVVSTARKVWPNYFPVLDGIVFIVDAHDKWRLEDAKAELDVSPRHDRPSVRTSLLLLSTPPCSSNDSRRTLLRPRIHSSTQELLADDDIAQCPILVLGNKIDMHGTVAATPLPRIEPSRVWGNADV